MDVLSFLWSLHYLPPRSSKVQVERSRTELEQNFKSPSSSQLRACRRARRPSIASAQRSTPPIDRETRARRSPSISRQCHAFWGEPERNAFWLSWVFIFICKLPYRRTCYRRTSGLKSLRTCQPELKNAQRFRKTPWKLQKSWFYKNAHDKNVA